MKIPNTFLPKEFVFANRNNYVILLSLLPTSIGAFKIDEDRN